MNSRMHLVSNITSRVASSWNRAVYTVFNIGGNDFRLITEIFYGDQTVLIRDVLRHAEYDKGDWKR
jgi:mRNA-degrading endonuclease HigB of HigAB toxin-antitoxin module